MILEYERQAPPEREVEVLVAELLHGVPLSDAEAQRARAIVRADVLARRELPVAPSGQPWAALDRGLELMAARDAALAALLGTDTQRAALAVNGEAQRRILANLRLRAEEQYRREHSAG